ncbi:MAG: DUF4160 domain-containing protein [Silvanigrellales bacterium]|nr:DUF4160 domain-containing protein [Silvanigrellales bacterium]
MPIISLFFGIIIRINFRDHNPPHFHAEYQGMQATFRIDTGKLLDGEFPAKMTRIVEEWAAEHREALQANWAKAVELEPTARIPGADN